MRSKQVFIIEEAIFDIIERLHYFVGVRDKSNYKLALQTLDLLCSDYKDLTKEDFFKNNEILNYYSKLWEIE